MKILTVKPLTAEAFSAYGEVIEMAGNSFFDINYGMAQRFNALAKVETNDNDGYPVISLVHSQKYDLPHTVKIVERHPLGSQAFIPREDTPFVVIVAQPGEHVKVENLRAFVTNGAQGVNYHKGVWHALLLTPFAEMDFICVDRYGAGDNCEEHRFSEQEQLTLEL